MTIQEWLEGERALLESLDNLMEMDRYVQGYYGAIINTLEFLSGPTTTENN